MGFRSHQRVNQQEMENHSEVYEWLLDISLRDEIKNKALAYRRADLCLKSKLEKVGLFLDYVKDVIFCIKSISRKYW